MQSTAPARASALTGRLGVDLRHAIERELREFFRPGIIDSAPECVTPIARHHRFITPAILSVGDIKDSAGKRIDVDDSAVTYDNTDILSIVVVQVLRSGGLVTAQR